MSRSSCQKSGPRASDRRFADQMSQMRERFEAADKRLDESNAHVDRRFTTLTWMVGVGFTVVSSLTTLFALLS